MSETNQDPDDIDILETLLYLKYQAERRMLRAQDAFDNKDGRQDRISYYKGQLAVLALLQDLYQYDIPIRTPAQERNIIKQKLGVKK